MRKSMPVLIVELPIDTKSEANSRDHWSVKAKRAAKQRRDAKYLCAINLKGFKAPHDSTLRVQLVRIAGRKLDDDNLRSALKAVRDGIADYLKIDDGSDKIKWEYEQMYLPKTKSIMMTIEVIDKDQGNEY